jgi:hypothetical protein
MSSRVAGDAVAEPMTAVLYLGLEPHLVDFSGFPDLSAEKLAAQLRAAGFDTEPYDVVLIGAGLRTAPPLLTLFETLINVVHQRAPQARLCFNTSTRDSEAAIRRQA